MVRLCCVSVNDDEMLSLVNRGSTTASDMHSCALLRSDHSPDQSLDVLFQQSDAALQQWAGSVTLQSNKTTFTNHDSSSSSGLGGEKSHANNISIHCGGCAGYNDCSPGCLTG